MSRKWIKVLVIVSLLLGIPIIGSRYLPEREDPFLVLYKENCAVCHGENFEGAAQGPALVGTELKHGESVVEIQQVIRRGVESTEMPAWSEVMDEGQTRSLAILISEKRLNIEMGELNVVSKITIPEDAIKSEDYRFQLEVFASDLDPLPFSIAPLPDGSFLLSERTKGISIISPEGMQSNLISGTPKVYDDALRVGELEIGLGWMMDVALHPNYKNNGWIYLHYTDRCGDECNRVGLSTFLPVSMNRLERGRIKDGKWIDAETIWESHRDTYTSAPEIGAGGRLAFDNLGHVFMSIGMKNGNEGIQDLDKPYGKILRINDDGSVPADNPYVVNSTEAKGSDASASLVRQLVWTFGHRSPQGLEINQLTGQLWGSEHGPRGGDEVNLLLPGRNYGWPLYSKGVNYNGTPVDGWKDPGTELDFEEIEQPIVDFTPSPAISSFVFYQGDAFPRWQNNIIIGSLKATELYRLVFKDNKLIHKETLIKNLARIRDIEVGYDGLIYLLLENEAGSKIVRLIPETNQAG